VAPYVRSIDKIAFIKQNFISPNRDINERAQVKQPGKQNEVNPNIIIRKAMEISSMCGQKFLMMIYDENTHRMVYYTSTNDFTLEEAYKAKKIAKQP
jgi:hypothetical protein